jgi:hypothetical protein
MPPFIETPSVGRATGIQQLLPLALQQAAFAWKAGSEVLRDSESAN